MHAWQTLFSWVNFHPTFLSNFPKFPSKLFEIQKISCYIVKRICWFALRVHIFVGNIWSPSINLSSVSLKLVMLMWIGNLKSNSISIHTSHVHSNDHLLLLVSRITVHFWGHKCYACLSFFFIRFPASGPQNLLSLWTNRIASIHSKRHVEFAGRLESKDNVAELYQHMNEDKG